MATIYNCFHCIFSITTYPPPPCPFPLPPTASPRHSHHHTVVPVLQLFLSVFCSIPPSHRPSCQPALSLWACLCVADQFSVFIRFHVEVKSYGNFLKNWDTDVQVAV